VIAEFLCLADYAIFSGPALDDFAPGPGDAQRLACVLATGVRHAGVTRGAEGYSWASADGASGHQPASPVNAVDTTGAGDAFHGLPQPWRHSNADVWAPGPVCRRLRSSNPSLLPRNEAVGASRLWGCGHGRRATASLNVRLKLGRRASAARNKGQWWPETRARNKGLNK
jgi:hypothetical protein